MQKVTKAAKREVERKIKDLIYHLEKTQGDFGRRAIFRAGGYGDKYTVITRTSVGSQYLKQILYYVDNNTGDLYSPLYQVATGTNPPSDEIVGHIDDVLGE